MKVRFNRPPDLPNEFTFEQVSLLHFLAAPVGVYQRIRSPTESSSATMNPIDYLIRVPVLGWDNSDHVQFIYLDKAQQVRRDTSYLKETKWAFRSDLRDITLSF